MPPPSVDQLARSIADVGLPHPLLVDAARAAIAAGDPDSARQRAEAQCRALLQPVVNATGVMLHTNLGRAPFAHTIDAGATNLEFTLEHGRRGHRSDHAGSLLARACGAEAGLVVNNGAAAVLLMLAALGAGRGVAVSRGELVEIGGGFRVPDVMAQAGVTLVEVGTTNRTRIEDFTSVVDRIAVAMKVHRSNYTITGFTAEASVAELAALPVPVLVDLGSGLLDAACPWMAGGPPQWLRGEPAVRQTLEDGADLVCFSGDKLLGGPQAGIIVGRSELVAACARHPLYRALRPGALVLSALQAVALAYLDRTAGSLPFWAMAATEVDVLRERAELLVGAVGQTAGSEAAAVDRCVIEVVECTSVAGGGTLPDVEIPSVGVRLRGDVTERLRRRPVPVIGRVTDGHTVLDLRTVRPEEDVHLHSALFDVARSAGRER